MLEAKVVVKMAREVFLDAEKMFTWRVGPDCAIWLWRLREIAFSTVLVECHYFTPAIIAVIRFEKKSIRRPATIGRTLTAPKSCSSGIDS